MTKPTTNAAASEDKRWTFGKRLGFGESGAGETGGETSSTSESSLTVWKGIGAIVGLMVATAAATWGEVGICGMEPWKNSLGVIAYIGGCVCYMVRIRFVTKRKKENFTVWGLKVVAGLFLCMLLALSKVSQPSMVLIMKLTCKEKPLLLLECILPRSNITFVLWGIHGRWRWWGMGKQKQKWLAWMARCDWERTKAQGFGASV
jgi:hypothetical protein